MAVCGWIWLKTRKAWLMLYHEWLSDLLFTICSMAHISDHSQIAATLQSALALHKKDVADIALQYQKRGRKVISKLLLSTTLPAFEYPQSNETKGYCSVSRWKHLMYQLTFYYLLLCNQCKNVPLPTSSFPLHHPANLHIPAMAYGNTHHLMGGRFFPPGVNQGDTFFFNPHIFDCSN